MARDIVERLKETAMMLPRSGYVSVGREATEASEEITALRARLEAVKKERDALGRDLNRAKYGEPDFAWSTHLAVLDETIARAERAEAALATARRDALEEAANEVDCGGCVNVGCVDPTNCWHKAAQDIRALIAQEEPTT